MEVTVHASATIGWHKDFAKRVCDGLKVLGVPHSVTTSRGRTSEGLAILLGTNSFRGVESGGPYLLVDRCSFGDTNKWVSLVRDGHGRRGDHRVPAGAPAHRWEKYAHAVLPWQSGSRVILCGQHEAYSPHWHNVEDWYEQVRPHCTHFRKHPEASNPTPLPEARSFNDAGRVVTLNSSIGVAAVMAGVPAVTLDEAAMAWDVSSHDPAETIKSVRLPWLHWLAWTQWTHDEIAEGKPWQHLL